MSTNYLPGVPKQHFFDVKWLSKRLFFFQFALFFFSSFSIASFRFLPRRLTALFCSCGISLELTSRDCFFFDFHAARLKLNCALTNFKAENKKNILLIKFFFPSTLSWFFSSHNFMKMLYRDHAGYYFKSLLCSDLTRKEREKNQRLFALRVCRICLSVFSREC